MNEPQVLLCGTCTFDLAGCGGNPMYATSIDDDASVKPGVELRIHLLGDPFVTYSRDGAEIKLAPRCLLLLAYLILYPKTRQRERIAAALWPDGSDGEARANLRRSLHDLVRALPADPTPWLVIDAQRVMWNPAAPAWCDVDAFDRFARDERTRQVAVDTYGGELLLARDADWLEAPRSRLRERQLETLAALAEACLASGDTSGAAHHYRRLLAYDPFREDAFRSLLRLRYARGDRARAAIEYRDFVTRLKSELGVEPMPETIACYERIVSGKNLELRLAPDSWQPGDRFALAGAAN